MKCKRTKTNHIRESFQGNMFSNVHMCVCYTKVRREKAAKKVVLFSNKFMLFAVENQISCFFVVNAAQNYLASFQNYFSFRITECVCIKFNDLI